MVLYIIPVFLPEPFSGVQERACPLAPEVVSEAVATDTVFAIAVFDLGNIVSSLEESESAFDLNKVRLGHVTGMHDVTYRNCCECKTTYLNISASCCYYFSEVLGIYFCYQFRTKRAAPSLEDYESCGC